MRRTAHRLSSPSICLLAVAAALFAAIIAQATEAPTKKQTAYLQFQKAEQMREALNGRPEPERTRRDYQHVIDAYRRVYYLSPASSKADASVVAVAELLAEAGRQFAPGEKDLHAAIGQYEFLRREYPGSKYRVEALFTIGQLYKDDLDDPGEAKATFEEFLHRYPHDQRVQKAREALAEVEHPKPKKDQVQEARAVNSPKAAPLPQPVTVQVAPPAAAKKTGLQLVTGIRHWSSPDSTRIAIDVDGPVEYQAGRVPNPDRIFFDLPNTKLASTLVGKSFEVQDGFLTKIRVAQYQRDSTRVVLEVENLSEYSAFLLPNPYRLIIDIHGRQSTPTQVANVSKTQAAEENTAKSQPAEASSRSILSGNVFAAKEPNSSPATTAPNAKAAKPGSSNSTEVASSSTPVPKRGPLSKTTVDNDDSPAPLPAPPNKGPSPSLVKAAPERSTAGTTTRAQHESSDDLLTDPGESGNQGIKATSQPTSAPTAVAVAPRDKSSKKTTKSSAPQTAAAREAAPTSAGDRSLIRALGLKIGRIVIDAGHGGHDTGTIGPNGLQEKDLVLDVSLRLGRLLENRLGADVIYTRDDDTFIPLETRTAIANEKQADLFISIHANSSPDPAARGVETYYLNFTSDADALEVAARENAVSQKSIHELQDLVKKITLKEKIEESRELASDVQQSLYSGLSSKSSSLRNRGVKKAPFVVLIGANMPSILAEISFVSNPTDEQRLETPEYRQKIAESLYHGIAKYVGGLSGVKVAKVTKEAGE